AQIGFEVSYPYYTMNTLQSAEHPNQLPSRSLRIILTYNYYHQMNEQHDIRFQQMQQWLSHFVPENDYQLTPASSDASFRRYFRLSKQDGSSYIIMDAPPQQENSETFIKVATLLEQHGINVPHIYQQDLQQGYLLLSDLGSTP